MMIERRTFPGILFLVLLCLCPWLVRSQPVLPNVAAKSGGGLVLLSWVCQYDGVRSITVQHSKDSLGGFQPIGKVKRVEKGIQAFVDGRPAAGRNFYKLVLVFNSGLSWTSNRCAVTMSRDELELYNKSILSNDSLQRFISADSEPGSIRERINNKRLATSMKLMDTVKDRQVNITDPPVKPKMPVLFEQPKIARESIDTSSKILTAPRPRVISLSFDDPTRGDATFIRPTYLSIDPESGNIIVMLPNDVSTRNYSIRFLNSAGKPVAEIPRITARHIVLDRRNFQHRGTYKFVLRRDYTELESGFVKLN